MNEKGFAARLRGLVSESSSERGFAREVGIPQGTLRGLLAGKSPTLDTLVTIATSKGVEYQWLVTGEGPKVRDQEISYPDLPGVPSLFSDGNDVAMVPRLDIQASAGHGSLVDHEDAVEFLAFPPDWLRRRGINPVAARALTARGDSMEPTIRSGDVLLVDTSWQRVDDNGIYVVVSAGFVLVKRVHPRRDGSLMLISDNTRYPPEDIPVTEVPDFQIAGRVMWFGRTI